MVMLEPSREDWALLVSIAVFKKLRIIRMPKASQLLLSNVLLSEQLASGRAIGAVRHKKLRE